MKITSVSYRRLVNLGNYENETVGAEVLLEPGDSAAEAMDEVKEWVTDRCARVMREREKLYQIERDAESVRRSIRTSREWLKLWHEKIEGLIPLMQPYIAGRLDNPITPAMLAEADVDPDAAPSDADEEPAERDDFPF